MNPTAYILGVVGALLLFRVSTALSGAGRMARTLRGVVGHEVRVTLCGTAQPGVMLVSSVAAFGAGLHIHFQLREGGRRHLKIAQPSDGVFEAKRVVIAKARYVEYERERVPLTGEAPVLLELA